MISLPTLREYARQYAIAHGLAPATVKAHTYVLNSFVRFLGREPVQKDLERDTINAWLFSELSSGLDAHTVHGRRRTILTLWRDAYEEGWVEVAPSRIRKIRLPQKVPNAWTQEQIQQLLRTINGMSGKLRLHPVSRCLFWRAYVMTGYYTGLRLGDLLRLRFDQIADDGSVVVIQNKTGTPVQCFIEADGMSAIEGILRPPRKLIFGDLMSKKCIQETFQKIVAKAQLRGSTKWLRSSGASWCEAVTPGSAMGFLGHRTHGLAYRHYVDPHVVQRQIPRPPKLT